MNFLSEFLSFFAWLKSRPHKSMPYKSMWIYLLLQNNAAAMRGEDGSWYWPVWFEVDNQALSRFLDGASTKRIWEYRRELVRDSRVEYQKASGGQPARYALVPFDTGMAQERICPEGNPQAQLVWNPAPEKARTPAGSFPEPAPEQNRLSSDFNLNHKYINNNKFSRDEGDNLNGFNIPPALTDEERARLAEEYPDEVARFWAGMALREEKAKEVDPWAY